MSELETRFAFGANWQHFLQDLDDGRIATAEASLRDMLGVTTLQGKRFVDVGSGSGLFSLAARRLGATVHSLDYDVQSVACTAELRRRYFPNDPLWTVEQGSALDADYLAKLGTFDVVYSWGVLHHTGNMWLGLDLVRSLVAPGGKLFIAIYNDQGVKSHVWTGIKWTYNVLPPALRFLVLWPSVAVLWGPASARDVVIGRPGRTWKNTRSRRGMSPWWDAIDWVGGYPFEVATPDEIQKYFESSGFLLTKSVLGVHGLGCNEFVFKR
jgi:SAM-dependent methyltransferase